jgi:hypothetical protein
MICVKGKMKLVVRLKLMKPVIRHSGNDEKMSL